MKILIKTIFVALLFFYNFALAEQSKTSIENPAVIRNFFNQPFLNGSAILRFLGVKVYDISLWSEGAGFSYSKSFAIEIKYNMNFSSNQLVQRSIDEIKKLHKLEKEEEVIYLDNLKRILPAVKKGDEKIAVFIPSKGVIMFHNGEITGKISDPKLSRLFVDIWLDEGGSYPEVTKKIIGKLN